MLKKAFVFAFLLSLCYYVVTYYWNKNYPELMAEQGQWQYNAIKAQSFLYDFSPQKFNCIVGTSLAYEILQESLPKNYINLSFRGQSVLDGLCILSQKKEIPDTLYVETNYLANTINKSFVQRIADNKLQVEIKRFAPMFREKYLPIGILTHYLYHKFGYLWYYYKLFLNKTFKIRPESKKRPSPNHNENNALLFKKVLTLDSLTLSKLPTNNNITEVFSNLKNLLTKLEERGVVLIFFEMPVHCKLANTPLPVFNKSEIQKYFPLTKYRYIENGGCQNFETTDGRHLNKESAVRYTEYFLKARQSI